MSAEDYNPPVTSRGEHILKFTSSDGELIVPVCVWEVHTNDLSRCRFVHGRSGGCSIDAPDVGITIIESYES